MRPTTQLLFAVLPASLALGACSDEFDPYNELLDFRVLAVRASPPFLGAGERTELDALVYQATPEPVSYEWSWCPLSAGPERDYECAVTEAQLQEAVDRVAGAGAVTVPSFALSTTATAALAYSVPPALFRGLCDAIKQIPVPSFVPELRCSRYFPVQVRLVAKAGTKRIVAIKELRMLYDATEPRNANPALGELSYRLASEPAAAPRLVDPASPPTLARGSKYLLTVELPEATSERYLKPGDDPAAPPTSAREVLVTTWFYERGDTKFMRTTFVPGEISLAAAGTNEWTAPKVASDPKDRARLILVVRDGRDGIGWLVRDVRLGE